MGTHDNLKCKQKHMLLEKQEHKQPIYQQQVGDSHIHFKTTQCLR